MDIPEIRGDPVDALGVRVDRLLKLLQATVSQTQVVVNVGLVRHEGLQGNRHLHRADALAVLLEGEVGDALLVQDLRVVRVYRQSTVQVIDRHLELIHVKVALSSVSKEFHVVFLVFADGFIEMVDSLLIIFESVVAAA